MVFEKIKKIMAEQLGLDENDITMDTSFEELGVDSLDLFQIIIEIEEEFGLQIEDAEAIKTVSEAVKFVEDNIEQ
ncbi:acyl carrier protein [Clostridium sp. CX1]|uniref:Acyl carrier protein n=1 Tax=Clostridium tanneri TaxID=3037988 RepID=A0ABU4JTX6_9CLOT|nr:MULTISPECIES: acyl carrier protein [unclassified Clostridium]MCT8977573.1 acyl carrier protein [Clostridium sp. CX1]MDW8801588.1 acyl carrier protein [Clostridium sp. A1-XYC3]